MADATVQVEIDERSDGRVARVTIDNQRRLNCLSTPLILELSRAFTRLADDTSLRAVVLTGAGDRAFIGGADLNELGALCADSARLFITRLHQACAGHPQVPGAGDRARQWVLPGRRPGGGGELRHARGRGHGAVRHARGAHGAAVGDRGRAAAGTDRLGQDARDAADGRPVFGGRGPEHGLRAKDRHGGGAGRRRRSLARRRSAARRRKPSARRRR